MVELDKSNIELKLFSSELSFEDSKVFKELMALYPWCSSFTVAYLKSLKTQNDLRFTSELEEYAVGLNSREVIYNLTRSFEIDTSNDITEIDPGEEVFETLSEEPVKTDPLDKLIESEALAAKVLKELKEAPEKSSNETVEALDLRRKKNQDTFKINKPETIDISTSRSFNDWLSVGAVQIDTENKKEFLTFEKPKVPFFSPVKKAKESLEMANLPVSETLAKVFESQGNYTMAKSTYEQLILIFPEKKSFFADQIQNLKNKTT